MADKPSKRRKWYVLALILCAALVWMLVQDVALIRAPGAYGTVFHYRGGMTQFAYVNGSTVSIETSVYDDSDTPLAYVSVGGRNVLEVNGRTIF
jgi:hypothetical protein